MKERNEYKLSAFRVPAWSARNQSCVFVPFFFFFLPSFVRNIFRCSNTKYIQVDWQLEKYRNRMYVRICKIANAFVNPINIRHPTLNVKHWTPKAPKALNTRTDSELRLAFQFETMSQFAHYFDFVLFSVFFLLLLLSIIWLTTENVFFNVQRVKIWIGIKAKKKKEKPETRPFLIIIHCGSFIFFWWPIYGVICLQIDSRLWEMWII